MGLQEDFLNSFFSKTQSFFLTGGNALNLFYFQHRVSEDLDCFGTDDAEYGRINSIIQQSCDTIGAVYSARQDFPEFKRFLISRGTESIIVDCVHERVPQLYPQKKMIGNIRVDVPEEMTANKLCALLGRAEYKDLVDLYFLQKNGYPALKYLSQASKKDGGISGVTLAYVLDQMDLANLPAGLKNVVPFNELESFRTNLRDQLLKDSFPGQSAI